MGRPERCAQAGDTFLIGLRKLTLIAALALLSVTAGAQCPVAPQMGVPVAEWDAIFTQDGPGKGLEPKGAPGWTGGDSTYSLLLPNGDTAFFFSDSYIGESPAVKGDGTVARTASGLRTTAINCPAPICDPPASIFKARNSIVILSRDRKRMKTLVGPKDASGLSTSYFKEPSDQLNYWMGDAIVLPSKGKKRSIFVFLHKFDSKLAFHGAAIAQLNAATLKIEKIVEVKSLPDPQIHWGTAMLAENRKLLIYGKGIHSGKKQMFLARTEIDTIERLADGSRWEVWTGREWSRRAADAASISPRDDSISDEFNIVKFDIHGKPTYMFAAIDTAVPFGSWRDITLYSSCKPEGPFTGKHVVYAMPESGSFTVPGLPVGSRLRENLVVYNPHIHSQFSSSGQLMISYNINRSHNADSVFIDGYRPRFIYVSIKGLN